MRRLDLNFPNPSEDESVKIVAAALEGDDKTWTTYLSNNPHIDGFELIYAHDSSDLEKLITKNGHPTLDWLKELASVPHNQKLSNPKKVLYILWHSLKWKITKLLQDTSEASPGSLPDKGFLFYFTENLKWCIVFRFRFSGTAAQIDPIHFIEEPQIVFDPYVLSHLADEYTKSIVKKLLSQQIKVIAHRGVLVNVNRWSEPNVFGPTIDTLYLHEFLTRLFVSQDFSESIYKSIKKAMEIGCGNGLLAAGLANKFHFLERLFVFDTNIEAIQCADRNINAAVPRDNNSNLSLYSICGGFEGGLVKDKFDLVLSNPPYLPIEPSTRSSLNDQLIPIEGTELIREMLQSSPKFLKRNGVLLLVYSNLAEDELLSYKPPEMDLIRLNKANGFRVLFDLEDVMHDGKWLKYLMKKGLEHDAGATAYHHHLKIGAIVHSNRSTAMGLANLVSRLGSGR